MYLLLAIIIIGLVAWAIVEASNRVRLAIVDRKFNLRETEAALNKAESALRRIANGAAAPALEAQIALDEITSYHDRFLN